MRHHSTGGMSFLMEPMEPRRLLAATTLRVDAGGSGHTEASGKVWQADRNVTGGVAATSSNAVAGTSEDGLFQSRRAGNFAYSLPIKSGTYRIKLLFDDPYFTAAGERTFNVLAERKLALSNFDIVAAGGANTAVTKVITVTVKDGRLNLWFQGVKDNATVSAIEITPAAAASIAWKPLADAPQNKFESMGAAIGGKLYVFGGYFNASIKTTAQVAVYDPATDGWKTLKDMPEKLTHSGTAVDGRFVYLAGGYVGDWKGTTTPVTRHVWRYDTSTDTWTGMLSLPVNRSAGALVRVGRKLHFFGGLDQKKRDRGDHWVLDLRKPTKWVAAPAMPDPRNHLGYTLAGTKVYAIGGQHDLDEQNGNDAQVDAFDVLTNTWSRVADLPHVTSHTHNSTFPFSGDKVMIVGGSTVNEASVQDVMEYDPAKNKWTTVGQLPVPLSAAVSQLLNGHIIVTGGTSGGSQPRALTWMSV